MCGLSRQEIVPYKIFGTRTKNFAPNTYTHRFFGISFPKVLREEMLKKKSFLFWLSLEISPNENETFVAI